MAHNKECSIIILDVRQSVCEAYKQKFIKYAADILKDKICSGKKDYISFVLLGTERTENDANANASQDAYLNIVQYPHVQLPTWQLLISFYKFVNEPASNEGEWLEALVAASEMLKNSKDIFKFQRQRIVLFCDFNDAACNYELFDCITENLMLREVELIVVTHNIEFIDNVNNPSEPRAIFSETKRTAQQLENEKFALRLVSSCNAKLCNFNVALSTIFKIYNKRPWAWTSKLSIGTKININIQGVIMIKDESNIKLKKCWSEKEEFAVRELKYFVGNNEVEPSPEDLIEGYMLGATPVPYDDSLVDVKLQREPGLKFIGFVKRSTIPDEYFCGDSFYWILHQRGMTASARKLDALVKTLLNTEMAILCWKIFSVKYNAPKLTVLLPNPLHPDKPASLSLFELSFHAQHHFWDFPTLCTKKTECSDAQIEAMDELIDAMDLMPKAYDGTKPRTTYTNDLLPFDALPHIYEQNIIDILERKILCNASEDDEQFQEMLEDKHFVEGYWKLPEAIEERAKSAAKAVKKCFPLEVSTLPLERAKARANATIKTEPQDNVKRLGNVGADLATTNASSSGELERVGVRTPSDDFEQLLKKHVILLTDNTQRDAKFQFYAAQLCAVLRLLLGVNKDALELEKFGNALKVLRKSCLDFNALTEYNTWMDELRSIVMSKRFYELWRDVIVKYELGLFIVGEESLAEKLKLQDFYNIDVPSTSSASFASFSTSNESSLTSPNASTSKESEGNEINEAQANEMLTKI